MSFFYLFLANSILGYGIIGHQLSGAIAQELLSDSSKQLVLELLPQYGGNLSHACTWGDEIKGNHGYDWAKPLHYVNPKNDFPPRTCSYTVDESDCPRGICVVSAIHNYTTRLLNFGGDRSAREEALKFLIHFIGDLHQPLHVTGRQRGGNQALAKFQGRITNMHAIWDYAMFERRIREDFQGSPKLYVQFILKQIATTWRAEISEWLACPTKSRILSFQSQKDDFFSHKNEQTTLVCPEKWAKFSNQVNCENVWPKYKRKYELGGQYYTDNILVEEKMLAQAAIRMSAIINSVVNA